MTIQDHTKSFISMMIIKLNQHSIILEKSWMKKHEISYHKHDDSISFHSEHCSHLRSTKNPFSQRTKKKLFFREEKLFDQSEIVNENKELLVFFEKTNSKTILKKSTSNQVVESVVRILKESQKKLNERRRINEFWRKTLRKIETSFSRILSKRSRKNLFYDETNSLSKVNSIETNNVLKIHSITAISFNTLSRQKDVKIFVVFIKNLNIQLKKQESSVVTNLKSVISIEYHDLLNVFSKKKIDVLSSHRKHNDWIGLKKNKIHEYTFLYNMSKRKLLLVKKHLQEHSNKNFIESSIASYAFLILFAKKSDEDFRFCVNYRKLNAIIKKNKYLILLIAEIIARLFKIKWMIKIDIHHAFNKIRMHSKENEDLTTFRTKYEIYKFLIMLFELINDFFTFQNFMNDTFMNYLDDFAIVYINDIIVYNNIKKKHIQHVKKIL
jgi:hypothetical protein